MVVCLAACGGSGDGGGSTPGGGAPAGSLSLFAGDMGGPGNLNGTGTAARFSFPSGITVDASANVYVADSGYHTVRKITPAGEVTTFAGTAGLPGSTDGIGAAARFNFPSGIAADSVGNVYVADEFNHTIRKITPAGVVTTLAGTAGIAGSANGIGAAASFNFPRHVTIDSSGNVYVTDTSNHTIRKITPTALVTTLAGAAGAAGNTDGPGGVARFSSPRGIATDGAGNVYVTDNGNDAIRRITPAGNVTTFAGGIGSAAGFNSLAGLAIDGAGNLYAADAGNHTLRRITPAGVVTTIAGTAGVEGRSDGAGSAARFRFPNGVATDSVGNVYVADELNHAIRKITPAGVVTTFAGVGDDPGSADGIGAAARFKTPDGIATDGAGNIYVADELNHAVRRITPAGQVTTFAGTAGLSGSTDGGAAARFNSPSGITADSAGNLYVADSANHTIRKITPAGVVTTFAGTPGVQGSADGTGPAARFNFPNGVAVDTASNLYVTDTNNHTVRKITPAGVVTTFAGTAGVSGSANGAGAAARFTLPQRIAVDSAGTLYVTETTHTIRRITSSGQVTTFAGTASLFGSTDGTGTAARFRFPSGLATDGAGNVYVADQDNNTVRRITPAGVVTTVVGVAQQNGFVAGALPGRLGIPRGVAISGTSLYITLYNGVAVVRNVP